MVILADFRSIDTMHFEINRFYVELYKCKLKQPVHVFAERKHLFALHKACPIDRQTAFVFYKPYSRSRIIRMYLLELAAVVRLIRVIIYAKTHRASLLHILNVSHFSHNVARIMLKVLPPGCPVLLSIHDELESVIKVEKRFWKLPFWFPMSLSIHVRNLYPIVLGNNIKTRMEKVNIQARDWICIEHPYTFAAPDATSYQNKPCLAVGTVGVASVSKGSQLLFKLAERFKDDVKAGRICFKIIGRVDPSMRPHVNPYVQFLDPGVFYDKEMFDRDIRALDAVLYCYPEDSYQLTASGALFDAIKFNKPIISSRNAYFEWVLRDVPDGYINWISNLDQVENVLRGWLLHGCPAVDHSAYDSIRRRHSSENVGREFAKQIDEKVGLSQ
ncbi:MAG: hypothetical protein ACYCOU_04485 [Sulfobacillus sp.]